MNESTKHIVFFTPGFPANEQDVNCIPILQSYVLHYYRRNINRNVKISVITFQYPFQKKQYQWNNIDVYAIGGCNKKGLRRIQTWLQVLYRFKQLNKTNKVTAIHSFWLTQCAFVGQLISSLFKIKHISTIVGLDALPGNKYIKLINLKKTTIVALSDFVAKKFKETTNKNVHRIISIGLDTENFTTNISDNPTIDILGVGNLHAIKNYSLFIEIVEELVKTFPNLKSMIIGNAEEFNMLKNLIASKRLDKNINLAGELPRHKVLDIMADSKLFLHPSVHEGQGYVFAEALYSGMTVVAFKVGNLVNSARVFTCNNKTEMIENLTALLGKKSDRKRVLMQDMQETVSAFNNLYFKNETK
ncbi:MAG TPA: glycosyltransferase family 4 protein [Bacteroidia bacterium]|nr:glycosyltransferase family 4 protein [Bacteroidia bacterium]